MIYNNTSSGLERAALDVWMFESFDMIWVLAFWLFRYLQTGVERGICHGLNGWKCLISVAE